MTALSDLKEFNFLESEISLWTFKGTLPKTNGHWIETSDELDAEIKNITLTQLEILTEQQEYSLLAQNNESSVLSILTDETHAGVIRDCISQNLPQRKIRNVKTLKNAKFYVAKFAHEDKILFAARKTDSSWTTRNSKTILNAIYKENELDISSNEGFRIQRNFDFFVDHNQLLVANKKNFESILNYRAAHEGDFAALRADESFSEIFADVDPLTEYVGTNRMQLRRMSAIKEKGFYANEEFMENLRSKYQEFGLNINFDEHGNIVPTAETCADIMTALLDHRLQSAFSGNKYDVPDAVQV